MFFAKVCHEINSSRHPLDTILLLITIRDWIDVLKEREI